MVNTEYKLMYPEFKLPIIIKRINNLSYVVNNLMKMVWWDVARFSEFSFDVSYDTESSLFTGEISFIVETRFYGELLSIG